MYRHYHSKIHKIVRTNKMEFIFLDRSEERRKEFQRQCDEEMERQWELETARENEIDLDEELEVQDYDSNDGWTSQFAGWDDDALMADQERTSDRMDWDGR